MRDLDGVVHTVPNGEVKVASNQTRTWARINQNVTVAFGTDIDRAIEVVEELGRAMAADPIWKRRILEPPRVERVESIEERGITLKILGTVRASEQWAAGGEFRKLLLEAFNRHGIRLPRPPQVFVAHSETTEGIHDRPGAEPGRARRRVGHVGDGADRTMSSRCRARLVSHGPRVEWVLEARDLRAPRARPRERPGLSAGVPL